MPVRRAQVTRCLLRSITGGPGPYLRRSRHLSPALTMPATNPPIVATAARAYRMVSAMFGILSLGAVFCGDDIEAAAEHGLEVPGLFQHA